MIKPTISIRGKTNASIIKVYPELENVVVTPTIEDQIVKSDMYGINEVKVKGVQSYIDEDIKPEYIKGGVDILGVIGNVVELQGEEKTIVPSISQQVILPSEDKNGMTKIIVEAVDNTIDEDIKPENIVDGVEILGVVGNYKGIDTSDATVSPSDVLEGKTVYINNQKIVGTLPNNGELAFDPSDEEQQVPEGYTSGGLIKSADITKLNEYEACLTLANSIETSKDYADTTATPKDLIKGKTAYSNGERIIGELELSDNNAVIQKDITSGTSSINGISKSLKELPEEMIISGTSCEYLFRGCSSLEKVPMIDTSNVTSMKYMINGCSSIKVIPSYNTSNVTNMYSMINGCSLLETAPIMDMSNVTDVSYMFGGCISLKTVPQYNISKVTSHNDMFGLCTNLSDESLNNILAMCTTAVKIKSNKTLKYIGLTSEQATRCQSLSNWAAFSAAGWTTGY